MQVQAAKETNEGPLEEESILLPSLRALFLHGRSFPFNPGVKVNAHVFKGVKETQGFVRGSQKEKPSVCRFLVTEPTYDIAMCPWKGIKEQATLEL